MVRLQRKISIPSTYVGLRLAYIITVTYTATKEQFYFNYIWHCNVQPRLQKYIVALHYTAPPTCLQFWRYTE